MYWDILRALAFVGCPIAAFSFLMVYFAYSKGYLAPEVKITDAFNKKVHPNAKLSKKNKKSLAFLHSKWMTFGGGYYGLLALLTFIYIEIKQITQFLLQVTGIQDFIGLLSINALVAMFVDSIMNMVKAAVWFTYWPKVFDMSNGFIWLLTSYLGYRIGAVLAQRHAIKMMAEC